MKQQNKKLQKMILRMMARDQALRKRALQNSQNKRIARLVFICDQKNIQKEKEIINTYGWPNFSLVGKRASHAFWLLVQHTDQDKDFQKKALELLEKAAKNKQAHLQDVAYLTDRISVAEGKRQKFGTQFIVKNNKIVPQPMRNKTQVNKWRAIYGLDSLEENWERMKKKYACLLIRH